LKLKAPNNLISVGTDFIHLGGRKQRKSFLIL
jgi:hypothetical protein